MGWDNNFHVPARTQALHPHHTSTAPSSYKHCTFMMVPYWGGLGGWGGVGVGRDNNIHVPARTSIAPSSHKHCTLTSSHKHCTLSTQALHEHCTLTSSHEHCTLITQALHVHHGSLLGWGGVGWDNDVHVPARTQALHPHHTSTAPSPS